VTWKPGESGHPGGRGKGIERVAREQADAWAEKLGFVGQHAGLRAAIQMACNRIDSGELDDKDLLAYIKFVVERIAGKARETVDLQVDGPVIDARMIALVEAARMTPHERRNLIDSPEPDGELDES